MSGFRTAVVGGSIAGCAAAIALRRAGSAVTVFERSAGELRDRGSGVAVPSALVDELVREGYLPPEYPTCALERRWWYHVDGTAQGRIVWDQPGAARLNNWGVLFRNLRAGVDDTDYRDGATVLGFSSAGDGVEVRTVTGVEHFDGLVGADGYRSAVRADMHPGTAPLYSGYVLWRGNYDEERVGDSAALDRLDSGRAAAMIAFPGGHGNLYLIPNFDGRTDRGHRRLTWNIYAPPPSGQDFTAARSVAPGEIDDAMYADFLALLDEHYPPDLAALVRLSTRDEISLQPIYDLTIPSYSRGGAVVIGDAAALTRPHTGSGATKALMDAVALERAARSATSWGQAGTAYDEARRAASNDVVELGRRIGEAQVTHTPDWLAMTPEDYERWAEDTLAGRRLYFWGSDEDAPVGSRQP
ncbi:NAD-binding protein [Pseudonocardia sp. KRD-184]|uniref:NAD-binding protein n=1 Tax=Pseudonocardia oceani TaxID=2792013 RepID=A0ABS6U515_9PSEU|nr:NAD-binding protein [Pseudonocardia oceani]MBW0090705.1 NAD-binding protein [Pseudonocardia oceani]MBW0097607.1 NAD-binding protein [Pseudonocardia oceani]MBW0124330.1 NAD-binding protein [Pseudonocardia oceani]MBW0127076.1 NAD-binding protein [Pseudonocardia oceani]